MPTAGKQVECLSSVLAQLPVPAHWQPAELLTVYSIWLLCQSAVVQPSTATGTEWHWHCHCVAACQSGGTTELQPTGAGQQSYTFGFQRSSVAPCGGHWHGSVRGIWNDSKPTSTPRPLQLPAAPTRAGIMTMPRRCQALSSTIWVKPKP